MYYIAKGAEILAPDTSDESCLLLCPPGLGYQQSIALSAFVLRGNVVVLPSWMSPRELAV